MDHPPTLVQESWQRLAPLGVELAHAFYERLFELDPRIRDLFAVTEMESQAAKFVAMVGEVVRLAGRPHEQETLLVASGRRHAGYGVLPHHYRTVGEALLQAIERVQPGGLDDETRVAWAEAYTRMAFVMQRAG